MKNFEKFLLESNKDNIVVGVDVDGTINNFADAYNELYKKYFPNEEVYPVDNWYWYMKMNYGGINDKEKQKWFKNIKAETFDVSKIYPNAVITINNIYDFIKSKGFKMNIVTNQVTQESRDKCKIWLDNYGFKYDEIIFVDSAKDKWKYADIMIDDADKVLNSKPLSKVSIKIEQLWNEGVDADFIIPNISSLTINIIQKAIDKLKLKNTL